MFRVCECGDEFETKFSQKVYCGSKCQLRFSYLHMWEKVKSIYQFRCKQLCNMAKNRAKSMKLPFNLDSNYLILLWEEQEGRCAISGRLFDLARPRETETVRANAPSLDRIHPKEGYIKGNVRFVCYQVNTALNEYGEEALISLCKDIVEFNAGVS